MQVAILWLRLLIGNLKVLGEARKNQGAGVAILW